MLADHRDAQRVRAVGMRDVRVLELRPLAVDDFIDSVVVFEMIVASQVIILRILGPPHDPAALIQLAGDGLHRDRNVDVFGGRIDGERDIERRIGVFRGLSQGLALADFHDGPRTDLGRKPSGDLACEVAVERPNTFAVFGRQQSVAKTTQNGRDGGDSHEKDFRGVPGGEVR